jgi:hypothetical protein
MVSFLSGKKFNILFGCHNPGCGCLGMQIVKYKKYRCHNVGYRAATDSHAMT